MAGTDQDGLTRIAEAFGVGIIYAFGSRAQDVVAFFEAGTPLAPSSSDVDIAVVATAPLGVDEKVRLGSALEDLLAVDRVDVVDLRTAPPYLALDAVSGALLHAVDGDAEARYQLFVLRRAADLLPFQRAREAAILGF